MKSIFLTFLFFIVVFSIAKINVLALFSHWSIRYGSFLLLFIVIGCAIYFVGLPTKNGKKLKPTEKKKEEKNE